MFSCFFVNFIYRKSLFFTQENQGVVYHAWTFCHRWQISKIEFSLFGEMFTLFIKLKIDKSRYNTIGEWKCIMITWPDSRLHCMLCVQKTFNAQFQVEQRKSNRFIIFKTITRHATYLQHWFLQKNCHCQPHVATKYVLDIRITRSTYFCILRFLFFFGSSLICGLCLQTK